MSVRCALMGSVFLAGLLVLPGSPAVALSCQSGVDSDFNGDGVADVAITDSSATVDDRADAGRVHVVYGGGVGSQTISQADSFVSGVPETGDRFGFSLASVDWNGDGCSDLVVGEPYEALGSLSESGHAQVLYGSSSGFGPNGQLSFSQDTSGMPGGAEVGDRFGFSLAAGVTTSGEPFLVFGVPGEDVNDPDGVSQVDAGAVNYVRGSIKLLTHQDKPGVFGGLEAGDQYGYSVAASSRYVAVGGPGEALGARGYSGTVGVFTHEVAAGTIGGWDQDQPGNSGSPEAGDWCGRSLAMVDYIPPGGSASEARSMLAVGCPGEALGETASAGRIVTIDVDGSGLTEIDSIDPADDGVAGGVEAGNYFGWSVQMVNRMPGEAVTWRDLLIAVGVPGEDWDGLPDAGAVQVFSAVSAPGDHDAWAESGGLAAAGWQRSADARFGQYVGASTTHLYVADPYGVAPAVYAIPWQNLTDDASGAVRAYRPGADGLPTESVGTFGAGVSAFQVYLDPSGSDSNDGLTPVTPVETLERAEAVVTAANPATDVEVRIAQGTYVASQTAWTYYVSGHSVSFLPATYTPGGPTPQRPVLRSDGSAGYWFRAKLPSGHPGGDTLLRFYYLQVENYSSGGLAIVGPTDTTSSDLRLPAGAGMNRNTIYGMKFTHLGSLHNPSSVGYGGVVLWNSSDNWIRNNHFSYLENIPSEKYLIHGVYASHGSSRNEVVANAFRYITGHPMNVRNSSDDNDVHENTFARTGQPTGAYYSDWFCDQPCVDAHPGHPRECASSGNVFHHNTLLSGYEGGWIKAFLLTPPGLDYPGGPGCDLDGEPRLRTRENVRP